MSNNYPPLMVKVWGDLACFTRPDMKVERVSYPVLTPSAARGILECIFWKPEFSWQIREIQVLNPIRHISIMRNEVTEKISVTSVKRWMNSKKVADFFADDNNNRVQRHTLALRDVAYIIKADVVLKPHANENIAKYRDMFRRRLQKGQCYRTPYLGCREFSAFFAPPDGSEQPIEYSDDLGLMLFDMDYHSDGSGHAKPKFFNARLVNGVLNVPIELYR